MFFCNGPKHGIKRGGKSVPFPTPRRARADETLLHGPTPFEREMAKLCQSVDRHAERKHAEQLLAECEGAKVASVRAAHDGKPRNVETNVRKYDCRTSKYDCFHESTTVPQP